MDWGEHVGAAEVVEEALGAARLDGVGAHAHDVDVRAEEAHDRGADRGGVARGDRALEAWVGFDVAKRRLDGWAVGLLAVDPFADAADRFAHRAFPRAGARGGVGWCDEQHDPDWERGVQGGGEGVGLQRAPADPDRPCGR